MPRQKDPAEGGGGSRTRRKPKSNVPLDWDVNGLYQLKCTSRYQPVDATEYVLDLRREEDSLDTAQLYAFFDFQKINLKGVMRLCPCPATDERLFLPEFESACDLDLDVHPGRTRREWLMRWRGEESGAKKVGGETRAQGQWFIKKDQHGDGMHITFAMVHYGKHLLFEGLRIGKPTTSTAETDDGEEIPAVEMMLSEWTRLNDESWEDDEVNGTGKYAPDYEVKHHNKWDFPPPGGLIVAKNKPGRNPGDFTNGVTPIEELPEWAWDVTGTYSVRSAQIAKRLGLDDLNTEMKIQMHMENNAQHTRIGRQLWGDLDFHRIQGNFRLCPGAVAAPHYMHEFPGLEEACLLPSGMWPGLPPQGEQQWGLLWRGYSRANDVLYAPSTMTEVYFSNYTGQIFLTGTIIIDSVPMMLVGARVGGPEKRSKNARTIVREWRKFLTPPPPEPEAVPEAVPEPEPEPEREPETEPETATATAPEPEAELETGPEPASTPKPVSELASPRAPAPPGHTQARFGLSQG